MANPNPNQTTLSVDEDGKEAKRFQPSAAKRPRGSFSRGGNFRGSGSKPQHEAPKAMISSMSVLSTQVEVALDITSLPAVIREVNGLFRDCFRQEREFSRFGYAHFVSVLYNIWLLLDKQASNRFGMGPVAFGREMIEVHDICSSIVESFCAVTLSGGMKLSTNHVHIVPIIKRQLLAASQRFVGHGFPEVNIPLDQIRLEEFPWSEVLTTFPVLRAGVSRAGGSNSVWRMPVPSESFSLLAHGVVTKENDIRVVVGSSPLPPRLEKLCQAIAVVHYHETGPASFIPRVIVAGDSSSLAARSGCYSGVGRTRRHALDELFTSLAPVTRV